MKPLPLPEIPALPAKVQAEPVGPYRNWPAPTTTCSNPASPTTDGVACATTTWSTKAVLSPPALSRPWKAIVCDPAATVNAAVV